MQTEDAASSRRARWLFLLATLLIVLASSLDIVASTVLSRIDWWRCSSAAVSGASTLHVGVDDLPYHEALALVIDKADIADFILLAIFTCTYTPLFLAAIWALQRKTQITILVMTGLFALFLWILNPDPSSTHNCDQHGSDHDFIVFVAPFFFVLPLAFVTWIAVKLSKSG